MELSIPKLKICAFSLCERIFCQSMLLKVTEQRQQLGYQQPGNSHLWLAKVVPNLSGKSIPVLDRQSIVNHPSSRLKSGPTICLILRASIMSRPFMGISRNRASSDMKSSLSDIREGASVGSRSVHSLISTSSRRSALLLAIINGPNDRTSACA
jgi:hypothetical protein